MNDDDRENLEVCVKSALAAYTEGKIFDALDLLDAAAQGQTPQSLFELVLSTLKLDPSEDLGPRTTEYLKALRDDPAFKNYDALVNHEPRSLKPAHLGAMTIGQVIDVIIRLNEAGVHPSGNFARSLFELDIEPAEACDACAVREVLLDSLRSVGDLEPDRVVCYRGATPISAQEMVRLLENHDADAVDFVQAVRAAAVRAVLLQPTSQRGAAES